MNECRLACFTRSVDRLSIYARIYAKLNPLLSSVHGKRPNSRGYSRAVFAMTVLSLMLHFRSKFYCRRRYR